MNAAQPVEEGNPQGVSGVVDVAGHYVVVAIDFHESRTVSYTHLTLPTMYSV